MTKNEIKTTNVARRIKRYRIIDQIEFSLGAVGLSSDQKFGNENFILTKNYTVTF